MFTMFICSMQFKWLHGDHSFTVVPKKLDFQAETRYLSA